MLWATARTRIGRGCFSPASRPRKMVSGCLRLIDLSPATWASSIALRFVDNQQIYQDSPDELRTGGNFCAFAAFLARLPGGANDCPKPRWAGSAVRRSLNRCRPLRRFWTQSRHGAGDQLATIEVHLCKATSIFSKRHSGMTLEQTPKEGCILITDL